MEKLAETIRKSGKSRYQIYKDTGIDQSVLHKIVNGGGCSIETADKLCKYLGLELVAKNRK